MIKTSPMKRILITKFRHHGDVLLTSPLFTILRNRYPDAQIDAIVFAETQEMLTMHPAINNIYVVDKKWKQKGLLFQLKQELALLKTLKAQHYDTLLHLTESMRGLWIARLTKIPLAVTFSNDRRDRIRTWRKIFTKRVPRVPLRHMVESHLDILRILNIHPEQEERKLCIVPGEQADMSVCQKLSDQGVDLTQPYIVCHPTSRWLFKCWKTTHVAEVINKLVIRGYQVVLSASPATQEIEMIEEIKQRLTEHVFDLSGKISLKELTSLIARAKMMIGVDSVPMHIAAAVQTPVVALFGPSGDKEWGPWMVPNRIIVSSHHSCRPCGKDGCGGSKVSDCLQQIPVQQVILAIDSLLEETAL